MVRGFGVMLQLGGFLSGLFSRYSVFLHTGLFGESEPSRDASWMESVRMEWCGPCSDHLGGRESSSSG